MVLGGNGVVILLAQYQIKKTMKEYSEINKSNKETIKNLNLDRI